MPRIEKEITVENDQGLHARPAALLVQVCSKYNSIVNISKDGEKVNGRSIMGILALAAQRGSVISVEVEGDDAELVIKELEDLLSGDKT
ncbi:MAG: HPr family phosphocarrier protein [Candidatus Zapsychrus exili]|nr:HPr family phosphocarrier protein [Candidatus Zapsychrus exili]